MHFAQFICFAFVQSYKCCFEGLKYRLELKAAVIANASEENVNALGEWFDHYGSDYWNGEYYDADDLRIYPVYKEVEEDEYEIIGYEVR